MLKSHYHVLGIMSGTSLDGLDIAQVNFTYLDGVWDFSLGICTTISYPIETKAQLANLVDLSDHDLNAVDNQYTHYLGSQIRQFIMANNIVNLDAVCSHGHTAVHKPNLGITRQIGNQEVLSKLIGVPVVCDFRVQDVVLGGQGAPLVPVGDKLLFKTYDYCLNLGGFANVSFSNNGQRLAFDLCPVNIVMNPFANALGLPYDDQGRLAKSGALLESKLEALNNLPYYKEVAPKSLGLEWVKEQFLPILNPELADVNNGLRTLVEHIAKQIASPLQENKRVLVTGGGAYNSYLLERIGFFKNLELVVPEPKLVEFKEALIFGFLGVLKLREEVNCLASVTGAKHDHSSGNIFMP